jgi:hypothetical protein
LRLTASPAAISLFDRSVPPVPFRPTAGPSGCQPAAGRSRVDAASRRGGGLASDLAERDSGFPLTAVKQISGLSRIM